MVWIAQWPASPTKVPAHVAWQRPALLGNCSLISCWPLLLSFVLLGAATQEKCRHDLYQAMQIMPPWGSQKSLQAVFTKSQRQNTESPAGAPRSLLSWKGKATPQTPGSTDSSCLLADCPACCEVTEGHQPS